MFLIFLKGQQIDDDVLIQMMVNDEISDSQGVESDSILAGMFTYRFIHILSRALRQV